MLIRNFPLVGGEILDQCLTRAKEHARFVECGVISMYNGAGTGLKNMAQVVTMRIRMQGFIIFDQRHHYQQARADLVKWIDEGKFKKTETVLKGGLPAAEQGLIDLYKGINTGKLMVEIKNPQDVPSKL